MYLKSILDGSKPWEIRENDRNFQIHDQLLLQEWDARYTGKELLVKIMYLFKGPRYGLEKGFCIMTIKPVDRENGTNAVALLDIIEEIVKPYRRRSIIGRELGDSLIEAVKNFNF